MKTLSPDAIRYEFVSGDFFWPIFKKHVHDVFDPNVLIDVTPLYSDAEKEKLASLKRQRDRFFLVAYDGEKIVGWSFGDQQEDHVFYMRNSVVFPDYRRRGIYSAMMDRMVAKAVEAGFQKIYSRHHLGNNAVIIAKLKKDFVIAGMETSDRYGSLVRLHYYPNASRRALFDARSGYKECDSKVIDAIRMKPHHDE